MWLLGRKVREIEMYLPLKGQKILLCFILPTLKALSNYANSRLKKKKERKKIFSSEAIKCFHYLMKAHLVKLSSLSQKMMGLSLTSHLQGRGHAQWG